VGLKTAAPQSLRDAQIMIVEENESFAGTASYVDALHGLVTTR